MTRIHSVAALATVALALLAPAAEAHKADPNFLTEVRQIEPRAAGIAVEVLNRSDALLLRNTSGRDVLIRGYEDEPYARLLADGTVEVNTNSPAHYLNEDRYGTTKPPAGVTAGSPVRWKELDGTGRFEWHDHRMHWMGKGRPPQVTDPEARTKVYDWSIPIEVGAQPGRIAGTLWWTPTAGGSVPVGAIVAGAAIVLVLALTVFVVRRRRSREPVPSSAEAW